MATAVKAMTPAEVTAATNNLVTAIQNEAIQAGQGVENRMGQLAPGLAADSNLQGGYNYQRVVAPIVDPLTAGLTTAAKQSVVKQALTDAAWKAQENYDVQQIKYDRRYRKFQEEQARRQRERQAEYDRQASASYGGGGYTVSGGGGVSVGSPVQVTTTGKRNPQPSMQQRRDGGFNFQDASGKPISAATYAKLTGVSFGGLLQQMSRAGDAGAKRALRSDASPEYARVYRALTWQ